MVKRLSGALAALVLVLGVAACGGKNGGSGDDSSSRDVADSPDSERTHGPQPTNDDGAPCTYNPAGPAERPVDQPAATAAYDGTVAAMLETSAGDIDVTLDAAAAPCTVNSFTSLATQGYYDHTPCHRLTSGGLSVLQCGDPSGTGSGGPGYSYADELSGAETYPAGTLAMANAGPNTNGSQFFLVYAESQLPPAYTVFGSIGEDGLLVLDDVAAQGIEGGAGDGAPAEPVDIEFVSIGEATPGTGVPSQPEPASDTCIYPADGSGTADPPPGEPTVAGTVPVTLDTSVGQLRARLDAKRTPCTVGSFVSLADQGYFDGTQCHRLTTKGIFVLQCGDPTATGTGGPGYSFADELDGSESYDPGTLAMANAGPDTNGSQFFIVYGNSPLPPSYTVFGKVSSASVKLVKNVARAGVKGGGADGPPKTLVRFDKVTAR